MEANRDIEIPVWEIYINLYINLFIYLFVCVDVCGNGKGKPLNDIGFNSNLFYFKTMMNWSNF